MPCSELEGMSGKGEKGHCWFHLESQSPKLVCLSIVTEQAGRTHLVMNEDCNQGCNIRITPITILIFSCKTKDCTEKSKWLLHWPQQKLPHCQLLA